MRILGKVSEIFVFSLLLMLIVLHGIAAEQQTKRPPRKLTDEEIQKLVKFANDWDIQQPKPNSKLVKLISHWSGTDPKTQITLYKLAFIENADEKRALVGGEYEDIFNNKNIIEVHDTDQCTVEHITCSSFMSSNHGIITSIQLIRAGHKKLGVALLEKALTVDSGHPRSQFYSAANQEPAAILSQSCLASVMREVVTPKPDFSKIKRKIKRILADQPNETAKYESSLEALQASIDHPAAQPGTIEHVIDEFLMSGVRDEKERVYGTIDERRKKLILLGFKAIPALIKQSDSNRATNHVCVGFNNFPTYNMISGQVISDYLRCLANDSESAWLDRQQGDTLDKEAFGKWWKEAAAMGEEAYVQKFTIRVIPNLDEQGKPTLSDAQIGDELLLIATERYPQYLPEFFRLLLTTQHYSWPVLDPIMESKNYSEQLKYELIMAAIATNHQAHRTEALSCLYDLRPVEAEQVLAKLLRNAATKVKVSGDFDNPETQDVELAQFVRQSKDKLVWQEYMELLERVEPELRIEHIHRLDTHQEMPVELLRSFQPIYDRYRTDTSVRKGSRFSFDVARSYPIISVENYIHLQWSEWLKLDIESPAAPGTELEWQNYRKAVNQEVKKRLAKS
jgi:hypothetical protein